MIKKLFFSWHTSATDVVMVMDFDPIEIPDAVAAEFTRSEPPRRQRVSLVKKGCRLRGPSRNSAWLEEFAPRASHA